MGASESSASPAVNPSRRPVRAYIDGCFDLMHSGHYNAIRQAKQLCDVLVVGIHSDEEIALNKAAPVMKQVERYELLRHIKWADELLFDVPYSPSLATLELANADFCIHGDDLPIGADGKGAYDEMRDAGRLKIIKRTEGVSTTDLVDRLLLLTREGTNPQDMELSVQGGHRHLLATTRRLAEFSSRVIPLADDVIVYLDGAFDLFHVGHALSLQRAKAQGTYLLVGVHDDESVVAAGGKRPLMNLHERVLNVCSCKYVDEVIIGAPITVTDDLLTTMKVSIVVTGDRPQVASVASEAVPERCDPYRVPRERGVLRKIEPAMPELTVDTIAQRIIRNRDLYLRRQQVRGVREDQYYNQKSTSQAGIGER